MTTDAPAPVLPPVPSGSRLRASAAAVPGDPAVTVTVLPPANGGPAAAWALAVGFVLLELGAANFLSNQARHLPGRVFAVTAAAFTAGPVLAIGLAGLAMLDRFGTTVLWVRDVGAGPEVTAERRAVGRRWRWADRAALAPPAWVEVTAAHGTVPDEAHAVVLRPGPGRPKADAVRLTPAVSAADAAWLHGALSNLAGGDAP